MEQRMEGEVESLDWSNYAPEFETCAESKRPNDKGLNRFKRKAQKPVAAEDTKPSDNFNTSETSSEDSSDYNEDSSGSIDFTDSKPDLQLNNRGLCALAECEDIKEEDTEPDNDKIEPVKSVNNSLNPFLSNNSPPVKSDINPFTSRPTPSPSSTFKPDRSDSDLGASADVNQNIKAKKAPVILTSDYEVDFRDALLSSTPAVSDDEEEKDTGSDDVLDREFQNTPSGDLLDEDPFELPTDLEPKVAPEPKTDEMAFASSLGFRSRGPFFGSTDTEKQDSYRPGFLPPTISPRYLEKGTQTVTSYRQPKLELFNDDPDRYFEENFVETTTYSTEEHINGVITMSEYSEHGLQVTYIPEPPPVAKPSPAAEPEHITLDINRGHSPMSDIDIPDINRGHSPISDIDVPDFKDLAACSSPRDNLQNPPRSPLPVEEEPPAIPYRTMPVIRKSPSPELPPVPPRVNSPRLASTPPPIPERSSTPKQTVTQTIPPIPPRTRSTPTPAEETKPPLPERRRPFYETFSAPKPDPVQEIIAPSRTVEVSMKPVHNGLTDRAASPRLNTSSPRLNTSSDRKNLSSSFESDRESNASGRDADVSQDIEPRETKTSTTSLRLKPITPSPAVRLSINKKENIKPLSLSSDKTPSLEDKTKHEHKPFSSILQEKVDIENRNISHLFKLPEKEQPNNKIHESRNKFISSDIKVSDDEKEKGLGTKSWESRPKPILKKSRGSESSPSESDRDSLKSGHNTSYRSDDIKQRIDAAVKEKIEQEKMKRLVNGPLKTPNSVKTPTGDNVFTFPDPKEDKNPYRYSTLPVPGVNRTRAKSFDDILASSSLTLPRQNSAAMLVRSPSGTNLQRVPSSFFIDSKSRQSLLETDIDTGETYESNVVVETDIDAVYNDRQDKTRSLTDLRPRSKSTAMTIKNIYDDTPHGKEKPIWEKTQSLTALHQLNLAGDNGVVDIDIDDNRDAKSEYGGDSAPFQRNSDERKSEHEMRVTKSLTKLNLPNWYIPAPQKEHSDDLYAPRSPTSPRSRYELSNKPVVIPTRVVTPISMRTPMRPSKSTPNVLEAVDFRLPSEKLKDKSGKVQPIRSCLKPPSYYKSQEFLDARDKSPNSSQDKIKFNYLLQKSKAPVNFGDDEPQTIVPRGTSTTETVSRKTSTIETRTTSTLHQEMMMSKAETSFDSNSSDGKRYVASTSISLASTQVKNKPPLPLRSTSLEKDEDSKRQSAVHVFNTRLSSSSSNEYDPKRPTVNVGDDLPPPPLIAPLKMPEFKPELWPPPLREPAKTPEKSLAKPEFKSRSLSLSSPMNIDDGIEFVDDGEEIQEPKHVPYHSLIKPQIEKERRRQRPEPSMKRQEVNTRIETSLDDNYEPNRVELRHPRSLPTEGLPEEPERSLSPVQLVRSPRISKQNETPSFRASYDQEPFSEIEADEYKPIQYRASRSPVVSPRPSQSSNRRFSPPSYKMETSVDDGPRFKPQTMKVETSIDDGPRMAPPTRKIETSLDDGPRMAPPTRKIETSLDDGPRMAPPTRNMETSLDDGPRMAPPTRRIETSLDDGPRMAPPTRKMETSIDDYPQIVPQTRKIETSLDEPVKKPVPTTRRVYRTRVRPPPAKMETSIDSPPTRIETSLDDGPKIVPPSRPEIKIQTSIDDRPTPRPRAKSLETNLDDPMADKSQLSLDISRLSDHSIDRSGNRSFGSSIEEGPVLMPPKKLQTSIDSGPVFMPPMKTRSKSLGTSLDDGPVMVPPKLESSIDSGPVFVSRSKLKPKETSIDDGPSLSFNLNDGPALTSSFRAPEPIYRRTKSKETSIDDESPSLSFKEAISPRFEAPMEFNPPATSSFNTKDRPELRKPRVQETTIDEDESSTSMRVLQSPAFEAEAPRVEAPVSPPSTYRTQRVTPAVVRGRVIAAPDRSVKRPSPVTPTGPPPAVPTSEPGPVVGRGAPKPRPTIQELTAEPEPRASRKDKKSRTPSWTAPWRKSKSPSRRNSNEVVEQKPDEPEKSSSWMPPWRKSGRKSSSGSVSSPPITPTESPSHPNFNIEGSHNGTSPYEDAPKMQESHQRHGLMRQPEDPYMSAPPQLPSTGPLTSRNIRPRVESSIDDDLPQQMDHPKQGGNMRQPSDVEFRAPPLPNGPPPQAQTRRERPRPRETSIDDDLPVNETSIDDPPVRKPIESNIDDVPRRVAAQVPAQAVRVAPGKGGRPQYRYQVRRAPVKVSNNASSKETCLDDSPPKPKSVETSIDDPLPVKSKPETPPQYRNGAVYNPNQARRVQYRPPPKRMPKETTLDGEVVSPRSTGSYKKPVETNIDDDLPGQKYHPGNYRKQAIETDIDGDLVPKSPPKSNPYDYVSKYSPTRSPQGYLETDIDFDEPANSFPPTQVTTTAPAYSSTTTEPRPTVAGSEAPTTTVERSSSVRLSRAPSITKEQLRDFFGDHPQKSPQPKLTPSQNASLSEVLDGLLGLPRSPPMMSPSSPNSVFDPHNTSTSSIISELDHNLVPGFEIRNINVQNSLQDIDEDSVKVKCRNSKCGKSVSLKEARQTYKTCHNCYTYYCTRNCRNAHWERHKKRCCYERVLSSCKHVIKRVHDDTDMLQKMSGIAKRGNMSKGPGFVLLEFSSLEEAERYTATGNDTMKNYPEFMAVTDSNLLEKDSTAVSQACSDYTSAQQFVVVVAVDTQLDTDMFTFTAGSSGPTIRKCAKLRLSETVSGVSKTISADKQETLILTASPTTHAPGLSSRETREVCFRNITEKLSSRGIDVEKDYPFVYRQLRAFAENNTNFRPINLYPKGKNGKTFMCIIMPDAEADIEWVTTYDPSAARR